MPTTSSPSTIVKGYFDAFFSKDVERTLDCLTDDVAWKVQGAADVPTVGARRGKQAVRDWIALFPGHFQPTEFEIDRLFENGDQCVVTGRFKHRVLATGKEFAGDFAAVCSVRDGKVCAYNFLEDSFGLWKAFQPG